MIVARNKSEEYIVDSALVGKWSIPAELQDDAHIICAGVSRKIYQLFISTVYCEYSNGIYAVL